VIVVVVVSASPAIDTAVPRRDAIRALWSRLDFTSFFMVGRYGSDGRLAPAYPHEQTRGQVSDGYLLYDRNPIPI
jgi:hypothetical protein